MAKGSGGTRGVDKAHSFHFLSENEYRTLASSQNISADEEAEIYDGDIVYIDSSWSREINANLVRENIGRNLPTDFMDSESRRAISVLDRVISKNVTDKDIRVKRRVSEYWLTENGRSLTKGMEFTEPRFTSTSAVTDKNYFGRRKVHLTIDIPKGKNAFVTKNYEESEIILPRNTKFRVSEYKVQNGIHIVRLTVI